MFIRPEQVAEFCAKYPEILRIRIEITRSKDSDHLIARIETDGTPQRDYRSALRETLKLRTDVEMCAPGSLPNDGKVIDDQRSYT